MQGFMHARGTSILPLSYTPAPEPVLGKDPPDNGEAFRITNPDLTGTSLLRSSVKPPDFASLSSVCNGAAKLSICLKV